MFAEYMHLPFHITIYYLSSKLSHISMHFIVYISVLKHLDCFIINPVSKCCVVIVLYDWPVLSMLLK